MTTTALRWDTTPDKIAILTFDQPGARANVMSRAMLAEFEQVLAEIEARPDLRGLVLRSGKPGTFIVGADLKELGSAEQNPDLARAMVRQGLALIARIESLPYPTVAAVEGPCMGGGLEIALGFDERLASTHPKTELGLPETKIGLIPGWGGTQRLPRVIGPALAVEMIASGEPVSARRAVEIGLAFDAVPSERLVDEAVRLIHLAHELGDWRTRRRKKQQPVGLTEEQLTYTFAVARGAVLAKTKGQLPAPLAAVEVIEKSCNKPLEEGLMIETEAFVKLVGSEISRNLIAVFFMNQRIQKDPGVADPNVKPREVQRAGVLGAGIMGSGIAGAFIRRGIPTMLLDVVPAALEKGVAAIQQVLKSRIEIGRSTPEEMIAALSRLSTTQTMAAMSDRDIVVEAVIENEATKVQVYQELQKYLPADAVLASNTSTISITRMAKSVRNPERFAGMHFFNPVDRMPLVEVIRGEQTSAVTVATLVALAKRLGKSPIVVKDGPGFLVNRILFPYLNEALALLEEGAGPREIDQAAVAFGMPMGPITLNDVVGLDTSLYAGRVVNTAFADRAVSTRILDELVQAGRLGQKSGAGFYSYAKDPKKGADDPAFTAILERVRTGRRTIAQEEITDRLFLPMLLEATRCLAEGIVREPADVDMGLILGIGFPAWRGGILRWTDAQGLDRVLARLKRYEHLGPRFHPTELLRKLAAEKKSFYPGGS
jgi:3-hydroxyacyl-CoA dehydrogenase/enoyl-CoA hydratase/3-hydroxybutyryl-CoA epimerase/3-hydroxyacyl-CoA dehydrogenase/enoyl-CoA hydratase/3-hydroxybutyryl-CoA epimerase/enoyl-CoA isomerase